jgi:hypothetical protein
LLVLPEHAGRDFQTEVKVPPFRCVALRLASKPYFSFFADSPYPAWRFPIEKATFDEILAFESSADPPTWFAVGERFRIGRQKVGAETTADVIEDIFRSSLTAECDECFEDRPCELALGRMATLGGGRPATAKSGYPWGISDSSLAYPEDLHWLVDTEEPPEDGVGGVAKPYNSLLKLSVDLGIYPDGGHSCTHS